MTTETKPKSQAQEKRDEKAQCLERLRNWLPPGSTVYTVLRHCARSGMSRSIDLFAIIDEKPFNISYWAARVMDDRIDGKHGGIKIGGCGMDMGFALVHQLSYALHGAGYQCPGSCCGDADHVNTRSPRDGTQFHEHGGYSLHHRWM